MSIEKSSGSHVIKSALVCLAYVIPAFTLLYLLINSPDFRSYLVVTSSSFCAEFLILVKATLNFSERIPDFIFYAMVGAFYWAQCVHYKLCKTENPRKYLNWVFNFQVSTFLISTILIPGAFVATENATILGWLVALHMFAVYMLFGLNQHDRNSCK